MRVVLSIGNFPGHPTGYGSQGVYILRALRRNGHEVVVVPWSVRLDSARSERLRYKTVPFYSGVQYSLSGAPLRLTSEDRALCSTGVHVMFNPYNVWPVSVDRKILDNIVLSARADLFIAFQDVFVLKCGPSLCPSLVWMPTHFQPIEHLTRKALDAFDAIVAMSRYGETVLSEVLGVHACGPSAKLFYYVPHACERSVFFPDSPTGESSTLRERVRGRWGWPLDAHVTLMVAANGEMSNRKAWDVQIQAWSSFARRMRASGRKAYLHIHSQAVGALDLPRILEVVGELPNRWDSYTRKMDEHGTSDVSGVRQATEGVRGPNCSITPTSLENRLPVEDLADMYRAADVLLAATCSEGFGVPVLEAQFCGTPVVTNQTTAMTELTLLGISVPPSHWTVRNDFRSGWFVPSVSGVAQALWEIAHWPAPELERRRSRAFPVLHKRYSPEAVEQGWTDILADVIRRTKALGGSLSEHNIARQQALQSSQILRSVPEHELRASTQGASILQEIRRLHTQVELLLAESIVTSPAALATAATSSLDTKAKRGPARKPGAAASSVGIAPSGLLSGLPSNLTKPIDNTSVAANSVTRS